MTPRQARTERRAAERKAKKADVRRSKQADLELDERPLEEEFSAELMAEANAMRDRVHRRAGLTLAAHDLTLDQRPNQNPDCKGGETVDEPAFLSEATSLQRKIQRRAEINRANSQHSTGPVSVQGKLASSRNSLKHGLASGQIIIPGEDASAFESLLAALLDEHQPGGTTEELLIAEMAQSHWLAQRALRLQNECFTAEGVDDKRLSLYMRYHTTHQRAFHKALTTLMKLKKEQARGFVSHSSKRATEKSGFVPQPIPESLKPNPESLAAPPETEFVRQNDRSEAA